MTNIFTMVNIAKRHYGLSLVWRFLSPNHDMETSAKFSNRRCIVDALGRKANHALESQVRISD